MMSFKSYLFQASIQVVVLVLLSMTPSNARQNVKVSSGIIDTICAKTRFPSYCLQLLESTPGAATADLKGLAEITLHLAQSNATETLHQLHLLIRKTSDPKLKESYESCCEHYDDAIGDLEDSEADFNQHDYYGMNVQASAAMTNAGDCDDEITDLAADPSIKKGNQDLDHICGIILAVSISLKD